MHARRGTRVVIAESNRSKTTAKLVASTLDPSTSTPPDSFRDPSSDVVDGLLDVSDLLSS